MTGNTKVNRNSRQQIININKLGHELKVSEPEQNIKNATQLPCCN